VAKSLTFVASPPFLWIKWGFVRFGLGVEGPVGVDKGLRAIGGPPFGKE